MSATDVPLPADTEGTSVSPLAGSLSSSAHVGRTSGEVRAVLGAKALVPGASRPGPTGTPAPVQSPEPHSVKDDNAVSKEHKLMLIVAFCTIVVLGLLAGEHFSKSRNQAQETQIGLSAPGVQVRPSQAGSDLVNPFEAGLVGSGSPEGTARARPRARPPWRPSPTCPPPR
jgi:hypothetical protein